MISDRLHIDYGYATFTTIKLVDMQPQYLKAHYKRLKEASILLDIDFDPTYEEFLIDVYGYLNDMEYTHDVIKYILNSTGRIITSRTNLQIDEYRCITSKIRSTESLLNNIKSCNYMENILQIKKLKDTKFNEVLYLNEFNNVCELSTCNIYFIRDNNIYTPKLTDGVLPGIIRDIIIDKFNIIEKSISIDEINNFDSCFATNCLKGCVYVSKINSISYAHNVLIDKINDYLNIYEE